MFLGSGGLGQNKQCGSQTCPPFSRSEYNCKGLGLTDTEMPCHMLHCFSQEIFFWNLFLTHSKL